ncbi:MAG: UDP-N-acetylmuramoylalanyl-D-glutamyl-2,6-diaminopimelate--D-alanyl-D-alanine ligase [Hyphomicrobium sp.]|jgi:UDP-N-acetylmuramoyl-tripeptide--D-alanyl-D-alanine ligase
MIRALWTFDELVRATSGAAEGVAAMPITGLSIDTRTLAPGDLFVALKDQRDGHDFVTTAFRAGAAAALVATAYETKPGDGALIRVADPLTGLEAIARAARDRLTSEARVIAVTGSVGKTGTKEMLRACCLRLGETHAADKSFNNHWGVPLTLARMPADTRYGIFEIGMNHPGEITPLTKMVRPHVAIVTTVEAVHLEHFSGVDAIAEAKGEIFAGLEPGGAAVLNRDNPFFSIMEKRAREAGARVISFGHHETASVRALKLDLLADASQIVATIAGRAVVYGLATPGAHVAQNSLAVVAALDAAGADIEVALGALAGLTAPPGRGARSELALSGGSALLIDESYNANPASMRAALAVLGAMPRDRYPRRIAVMGDMLELGSDAAGLHAGLAEAVDAAGVDLVFASGPNMAHLLAALPPSRRGAWAQTASDLRDTLLAALRAGDVVMIKGSFGSRMGPLAEAIRARLAAVPM